MKERENPKEDFFRRNIVMEVFSFQRSDSLKCFEKNLYDVVVAFQTGRWNFLLSLLAYAESSRGTGFVRSYLSFSSVRLPLLALSV